MRDAIYRQIMERGFHPKREAFVQHYDTDVLDASLLYMPLVGFISPTDPMWQSTLRAMDEELVSDSLVYRYDPQRLAGRAARLGGHVHDLHVLVRRRARPLRPARRRPARRSRRC